jgi:hypothetical protein
MLEERRQQLAIGRYFTRTLPCMAALAAMLFAGCVSSPAPQSMARTSLQTAPADLQLSCAAAAAAQFGIDSNSVLPVSSSQIDAQQYQVELDMRGQRSTCTIDNAGNVISVQGV